MKCPICQQSSQVRFSAHQIPIRDCLHCGHRFAEVHADSAHIAATYDDSYFSGGGAGYSDYTSEELLLRTAGQRYARLMSRWMRPGELIDVGAAAGFVLQGYRDHGWSGTGVEPNPTMAEFGRKQFGHTMFTGSFESFTASEPVDLVSMIQVIAHFANPKQALAHAASLLKPSGYLVIESWNYRSKMARMLGQHWHEYSPPSVLHWFTPNSLAQLAQAVGFMPIHRGFPQKWIDAGHAFSLMGYKLGPSLAGKMVRLASHCTPKYLPIPYPSEDLFWLVLQKH